MTKWRFPGWLAAVLLALVTLALYWPVTGFDFINYDDPDFVTSNAHVQGGLNWEAVKWAFQRNEGDYWHPLTWLSLMLDVSLFGREAGGFHFTNVALHAANSVLLFFLLRLLTGAFWRSALVAALFALHPLRVESVAWVTERKDVLSGCFGLLALIAYAGYVEVQSSKSEVGSHVPQTTDHGPRTTDHRSLITDHRLLFYLLSLSFFVCGLMSKAMVVTLPCVMLLLDYWPLKRNAEGGMRNAESGGGGTGQPRALLWLKLVWEKVPFFALSGISCLLTYLTENRRQQAAGLLESSAVHRIENAFVAYARYLGKTFWPVNLAVPYTDPGHWPWLEVAGSVLVVVGGCLVVLWLGRRRPYLLVGWCWFLGTLIPVISLTLAFMADRFTYLPSIGVLILTVWGACELTRSWRYQVLALSVAGGAAIVLCLALTRQQIGYWKDSEALFRHALAVTEDNWLAHNNLGDAFVKKGQWDEAISQYQETVRLKPQDAPPRYNLGNIFARKGQMDKAISQFEEALRLKPDYGEAHNNLGNALLGKGQLDEAIHQYRETLRLKPDSAEAHCNLGIALTRKGQTGEAIRQYQEALRLKPDYAEAQNNLDYVRTEYPKVLVAQASAFAGQGKYAEAIRIYEAALKAQPDQEGILNNLAWLLASCPDAASRNGPEAVRLATRACELTGYAQPLLIGTLAAAQAEAGDFPAAIATAERAADLASTLHLEQVAAKNQELIQLYRQGQPFHEKPDTTTDGHR